MPCYFSITTCDFVIVIVVLQHVHQHQVISNKPTGTCHYALDECSGMNKAPHPALVHSVFVVCMRVKTAWYFGGFHHRT